MKKQASFSVLSSKLLSLLIGGLLVSSVLAQDRVSELPPTRVRTVAANLSSGGQQNWDAGDGLRILKGLGADVVMLQEFNYKSNSPADLQEFIVSALGEGYAYRESETSDQIPNGIISRFPILESGEWTDVTMPNRDFAYARLDIPGNRELWAVSVHLSAKKSEARQAEATELRRLIQEKIPPEDYVVLGGDFNLTSREDAVIRILQDTVYEVAAPIDSYGNSTTNLPRKKNYDWLLTDSDLAACLVPVSFVYDQSEAWVEGYNLFTNGLVFDSTIFPNLNVVAPIQSGDSRAAGMQHLAVVKDFLIPVGTSLRHPVGGGSEAPR